MTEEFNRFRVIEGGPAGDGQPKPKRYRSRGPGDIEPLVCRCGSSTTIETVTGRMLKDGRLLRSTGTKQIVCYHCGTVLL